MPCPNQYPQPTPLIAIAKEDDGEYDDSFLRAALFGPAHPAATLDGGGATASTAPIDCDAWSSGASSSGGGSFGAGGSDGGGHSITTASTTGLLLTVGGGGGNAGPNLVI